MGTIVITDLFLRDMKFYIVEIQVTRPSQIIDLCRSRDGLLSIHLAAVGIGSCVFDSDDGLVFVEPNLARLQRVFDDVVGFEDVVEFFELGEEVSICSFASSKLAILTVRPLVSGNRKYQTTVWNEHQMQKMI